MVKPLTDRDIAPEQLAQLDDISLSAELPLLITDADEVLFAFMAAFEAFLQDTGHFFDWSSFALTGNIRRQSDSSAVDGADVGNLLATFFVECTGSMAPVEGAAEALSALSERLQIIVLSNLPLEQRPVRQKALHDHGMGYPLIAGAGPKGPLVARIAEAVSAPVFFVDDGPNHHGSVARHADHVRRLHMIADKRLARMLAAAPHSHHRADDWREARRLIEGELDAAGF
jgi:hypothetical protein